MCDNDNSNAISSIELEIKHIKSHQATDRGTLGELRRALYGHDGEPGLVGKVSSMSDKVTRLENTFKDVRKAVWAVVFLLIALVITDLYNTFISAANTIQP